MSSAEELAAAAALAEAEAHAQAADQAAAAAAGNNNAGVHAGGGDGVAGTSNAAGGAGGTVLDWLSDDFLNGECFVSGETGELEEALGHRQIVFPYGSPSADDPDTNVRFTSNQAEDFIRLNYHRLARAKPNLQAADVAKIAFLRFLAARTGLVSPKFDVAVHHVRYNEAIQLTQQQTVVELNAARTNVRALVPVATLKYLQLNFTNIVCCVAFMFRVRGHHYIEDMRVKYAELWKCCQKQGDHPGVTWDLIAHDALHAIMPDTLDGYWVKHSKAGTVAGALEKRLDSAPAGVAAVRAVYAGAEDLRMCIPGIYTKFKSHFDELDQLVDTLQKNRWAGSINRRFYGPEAVAITFNEQRFGAIAAVVVQCLHAFSPISPLLQSKALLRIANNAPITGGFISTGIAALAKDPALTRLMLEVPARDQ